MRLSWSCFSFLPSANTLRPRIIAFSKICIGGDRYFYLRNYSFCVTTLTLQGIIRILYKVLADFVQPRLFVGRGVQETQISQFKYVSYAVSIVLLLLIMSSLVFNDFDFFFLPFFFQVHFLLDSGSPNQVCFQLCI